MAAHMARLYPMMCSIAIHGSDYEVVWSEMGLGAGHSLVIGTLSSAAQPRQPMLPDGYLDCSC